MKKYVISRIGETYQIETIERNGFYELLKERDEAYPIEDNIFEIYKEYKRLHQEERPFLRSVFENCHKNNVHNKEYDKFSLRRRKVFCDFLNEKIVNVRQNHLNKFFLYLADRPYATSYYVLKKEELAIAAKLVLDDLFRLFDPVPIKRSDVKKALGLTPQQMKGVWNSKEKGLMSFEISDEQEEILKEYLLNQMPYEKIIGWLTDGYYEEVDVFLFFPTKETFKYRMRSELRAKE